MVTKFHNISVDPTLSNNSNILAPSERAVRAFVASKAIQLDFLQATTPITYTTGQKWLNTQSNILYTATSNSTWDAGLVISIDQFFTFNDLLYYYDGTNIVTYSTHSITETHNDNKLKFWVGTTDEYDDLGTYDSNTIYIKSDDTPATSAVLATQTEFDNGSTTTAATPYQIKQELGNYLPKSGGNLDASAVLRLTNANNDVSTLAFNTDGYLTISSSLYVTSALDVNSIVVRSGNIYKTNTSGAKAVWNNDYASTSNAGVVKVDGITITINSNGTISSNGSLPSQTGQSGKFLTTDGTNASWASVSAPANVYTEDNLKAGTGISKSKGAFTTNYAIVGYPTVIDGVLSNISDDNYVSVYNYFNDVTTSFEAVTAIKLNSNSTTNCGIIDTGLDAIYNVRLSTTSTNSVKLRISANGSGTLIVDITGTTVLSLNTKYFIKATYDSTNGYALYTSTNGQTWTTEGTSSTTTKPYNNAKHLFIGDNAVQGASLPGSLYLKDTYINVNGSRVWTPAEESNVSYIDNGVQSGNNISITESDEDTLLLCHFDGNLKDTSQYNSTPLYYNNNTQTTGNAYFTDAKFGKCLFNFSPEIRYYSAFKEKLVASKEFTIDFWTKKETDTISSIRTYFSLTTTGEHFGYRVVDNQLYLLSLPFGMYVGTSSTSYYADISNISDYSWFHVAITIKNNVGYIFVNGKLLTTGTVSDYWFDSSRILGYIGLAGTAHYLEELRISSVARWTSDFEVPKRPYSENKIINCTLDPNAKANIALDNLSDAGNIVAAKASMPSYYFDTITAGASGSTYTAPSDGWYYLNGATTAQGGYGYLQESTTSMSSTIQQGFSASVTTTTSGILPVKKGMEVELLYGDYTINSFKFIYAEGSISEASITAYHGTN